MCDDLLRTGAGNLFMVFGEPDVEIARSEDGRIGGEIRSVDVHDPTTGVRRSNTVDASPGWMVGTDLDPPQTGRIAVKVLDHDRDEVLKVHPVT